ncbi:MAG: hypothetical protein ACXWC9_07775 [Pseudobdellovibrionaceae bacterium]
MLRIGCILVILFLQIPLAQANFACFSAHRKPLESAILIEAKDPRWSEIGRRTVARLNQLLGTFAVKDFKIRISSEENAFSSSHRPEEILVGVLGSIRLSDFKVLTAHELGHEVFEQHFKSALDGQVDTFQNHRMAARERQTDTDHKLEAIDTKYRSYQVYQELLGDIFSAYFVKDPQAIPKALSRSLESMSETDRARFLSETPLALDFFRVRSLDLTPEHASLLVPLTMTQQMHGRLVHYQMLNQVRTKIWRQVLAQLKSEDFPQFVDAYLSAVHSHRQIHQHVHFKFFDEFNLNFWNLLVENLQLRGIQVLP